jgi:hypothetical protein
LVDSQSLTEAGKVANVKASILNSNMAITHIESLNSRVTFASIARNQMMGSSEEPSDSILSLAETGQFMSSHIFIVN